jgi:hypothetical protein
MGGRSKWIRTVRNGALWKVVLRSINVLYLFADGVCLYTSWCDWLSLLLVCVHAGNSINKQISDIKRGATSHCLLIFNFLIFEF